MAEGNLAVLPQFSPPGRVGAGIVVPNGPLVGLGAQQCVVLAANTCFVHLHRIADLYVREWTFEFWFECRLNYIYSVYFARESESNRPNL